VTDTAPVLAGGRQVTLLPRNGGHSWAGIVRAWDAVDDRVVARIQAHAEAVSSLDHHQVWLSTVSRNGAEHGVTIFAGRALAIERESLRLEGVVRLADERRRRAVRATGSTVTLPWLDGGQLTVAALDVSRGGVRLPALEGGWKYDGLVDLVVNLDGATSINAVGRMLRIDTETKSVVLRFEGLPDRAAEAFDRYALAQLTVPNGDPTPHG
jgi:hypothetical protein